MNSSNDVTVNTLVAGLGCRQKTAELWRLPLIEAAKEFKITGVAEFAAWTAQCAHESGNFERVVENLNYSAERLMKVWSRRFPYLSVAREFANNPQKLANKVYANRLGNGTEESGDGHKFRGRGIIQITGKANYERCGAALNLDLVSHPELLEQPMNAARSAGWFWLSHNLSDYITRNDFDSTTRIINGGMTGAAERRKLFTNLLKELQP